MRLRRSSLVAVALGGGIGTWLRYELELRLAPVTPPAFPSVTFAINLVGSFLLGMLITLVAEHWPPTRYVRGFAGIGLLGGFTTFSTMVVEVDRLVGSGSGGLASLYLLLSLVGGIVAVASGAAAANLWPRRFRRGRRHR